VLHAISSAYHNLMPPACYPFALLFLDCDPEEVDVNVHPSKTEVRFHHGSFVHDFVRDSIRAHLIASRPASAVPPGAISAPPSREVQPGARLPYSEFTQQLENLQFDRARNVLDASNPVPQPPPAGAEAGEVLPEFTLRQARGPDPKFEFDAAVPLPGEADALKLKVPETHGPLPEGASVADLQNLGSLADLRPLGQIHDSFIVAAGPDGLWIIDQHVAHERILFEQVLRQQAAGRIESQRMLMPIVLELTPAQQVEYSEIAGDLNSMGFETEPFGNRTIAVKAAPAGIGAADIERLIFEILEIREGEMRKISLGDLRRGMAASIACRAAIKINMTLNQKKMEWLLGELAKTDCPMSCPHGRPIALRYSTREILKSFHRI